MGMSYKFPYKESPYIVVPAVSVESTVFSLLSAGLHKPILMSSESSLTRPQSIYQKFELYPQHCVLFFEAR